MKRLLPFIPIIILLFLANSCDATYPPEIMTAIAGMTQTAAKWTPVPIATIDPSFRMITDAINSDLSATDSLGQFIDAAYLVSDAYFQPVPDSQTMAFVLNVRCTCADETECCTPARTFVVITNSMKKEFIRNSVLNFIDPKVNSMNINEIKVVCIHKGTKKAMSAPWFYMREYLINNISGYQFGVQVTSAAP